MSMIFIVPRRSAFLSCEKNRLWDSTRETRFGRIFQSNWIPEQPEPNSTDGATKSNADDLVEESTSAGCGPVGARPTTQPTSSEPHPAADRVAAAVVQFQAALGKIKQWGQRTDCTSSASPSPWPCRSVLNIFFPKKKSYGREKKEHRAPPTWGGGEKKPVKNKLEKDSWLSRLIVAERFVFVCFRVVTGLLHWVSLSTFESSKLESSLEKKRSKRPVGGEIFSSYRVLLRFLLENLWNWTEWCGRRVFWVLPFPYFIFLWWSSDNTGCVCVP